ncbi:hypothetical protein EJ05DRAFT_473967 [Pseudovirgaria hyperparasitica]|uniref:Arabinanase/levansucrase/invertase n=1 Tax=Pseudovirgaria hyperparasitica TaxID=470096 RepID=A0A6A6WHC2_9PEZI|nr:uncharacterized protein EJ05DRAFT_473967 [Pseudovirgaria hyperparasitica]KAF2761470.1 hypothetical protein EJ05DRAFT_473967 [Pseudovirgaria hyperparasitica]
MLASCFAVLLTVACLQGTVVARQQGATVIFSNTNRFLFDVDGKQIDAYGAKINYFNGKYYFYGTSWANPSNFGFKFYSSVDLVNWQYENFINATGSGRPHVIYNQATKKYTLWADANTGQLVQTSDSPASGYSSGKYADLDPQYSSLHPADAGVESFGDKGYLVWSALNFADPRQGSIWPLIYQTMHISPLTSDFTNTDTTSYNVTSAAFDLVDQQTESPDLFMRNDTFYVSASNSCAFCSGSIGVLYRSKSIQGPWQRQILSGYSCGGQVEGILPLTDPTTGKVTHVWHSTTNPGGPRVGLNGHIFQPLQFNADGSAKELDCSDGARFRVSFTPGTGDTASGSYTKAVDKAPQFANYRSVCDSDVYYTLHQTWRTSKSGILQSVSVNVAAGGNKNALDIKVFRFTNIQQLLSAGYKYELLGSATFVPSANLTEVFDTATVSVNRAVKKGDMLGFSFGEKNVLGFGLGNYIPYCHLEYDLNAVEQQCDLQQPVLIEQGSGQNSPRGLNGMESPIKVRNGKGMKFHANIV